MHLVRKVLPENLMSIGDVDRATGISEFKLRMWERRYNFPVPLKLESGHRRYTSEMVEHLKLIKLALDEGGRISKLVKLSIAELKLVVASSEVKDVVREVEFGDIIQMARRWEENTIIAKFEKNWDKHGPLGFVQNFAVELIGRIGNDWQKGIITVAEEHFLSEILEKFLVSKWDVMNQRLGGKSLMLTTLENEVHSFGINFCAVAACQAGVKVTNLGASLPNEEIAGAVKQGDINAVCISVSSNYPVAKAVANLKRIRALIPAELPIIVGGRGAPKDIEGVKVISDFSTFYDWVSDNLVSNYS